MLRGAGIFFLGGGGSGLQAPKLCRGDFRAEGRGVTLSRVMYTRVTLGKVRCKRR